MEIKKIWTLGPAETVSLATERSCNSFPPGFAIPLVARSRQRKTLACTTGDAGLIKFSQPQHREECSVPCNNTWVLWHRTMPMIVCTKQNADAGIGSVARCCFTSVHLVAGQKEIIDNALSSRLVGSRRLAWLTLRSHLKQATRVRVRFLLYLSALEMSLDRWSFYERSSWQNYNVWNWNLDWCVWMNIACNSSFPRWIFSLFDDITKCINLFWRALAIVEGLLWKRFSLPCSGCSIFPKRKAIQDTKSERRGTT